VINGRPSQVVLLPSQLSRLAEQFPDGGAVAISQNGSVTSAFNGEKKVVLNAEGKSLTNSTQETYPKC
jgi:hypothetical protein